MLQTYESCTTYETKDGSIIRELIHPDKQAGCRQSLAEAIVLPQKSTLLHCHESSEEIYFISSGTGRMTLGNEQVKVKDGDSILILPGTPHKIKNTGDDMLKILCCCTPPYSHQDTKIISNKSDNNQ
jgi:mannose-6-phosphate isomerase-like protein (cupin superfamily)